MQRAIQLAFQVSKPSFHGLRTATGTRPILAWSPRTTITRTTRGRCWTATIRTASTKTRTTGARTARSAALKIRVLFCVCRSVAGFRRDGRFVSPFFCSLDVC